MDFLKKIISHELITGSFYLFLGGMAGNLFAFFLNLFLARNLSYADYGIFASLLSIINLAYIPAGSINSIIVKFATDYYVKKNFNQVSAFYKYCAKVLFSVAGFFFVFFIFLAIPLNNFLNLGNFWYIIVLAFTISIFYMYTLNLAFLQSFLKFKFMSFINTFAGIIKLLTGILFVYLGFRAFSGLWAIFFMTLGSFIVAFFPIKKVISFKILEKTEIAKDEIIKFSIPAFFTSLFLTSFTSMDVILVKHFFTPHDAGFYAGISLVAKVIFYFTAPIPLVLFPLLVKRHTLKQNFKKMFYLAILLVLAPSVAITAFYFFNPAFVINLFLGGRDYLNYSGYLGMFGIFITIFGVANVFVSLLLSLNMTKVVYPVFVFAIIQVTLVSVFHNGFSDIIYASIFSSSALLIFLTLYYFKKLG